ncbi:MAG: tRNA (adenosine(37)-N6)-threonylcarbamoyltransferase complex ATPase subunit type 1 TsaE [Clostridiales bacterium]|nr:tRNA (adenosine(37)-N6)-threonylcarbamoyltransferase complex ATPase subunit type 1 TsaE [Clostridiales bacterium]
MIVKSYSAAETFDLACGLAQKAKPGDIFCLTGELGCGKTVFAQGFGQGLNVGSQIVSPTFTILNIYDKPMQKFPLYHFDVYRIRSSDEMKDIGFEEYIFGDGVCLIEWAEIIKALIPETAHWIHIKKDLTISEAYRIITL